MTRLAHCHQINMLQLNMLVGKQACSPTRCIVVPAPLPLNRRLISRRAVPGSKVGQPAKWCASTGGASIIVGGAGGRQERRGAPSLCWRAPAVAGPPAICKPQNDCCAFITHEMQASQPPAAPPTAARTSALRAARPAATGAAGSGSGTGTAPTSIMQDLAVCFRDQLGMTNGCLPASLLLHEILAARGVDCRLRQGYLLLELTEEGSPPPVLAVAHLWVEAEDGSGGSNGSSSSGSGSSSVLDIGMELAMAAGAPPTDHRLSADLPPDALRADLADPEMGRGAAMTEAAMRAFASERDAAQLQRAMGTYWAGAPPALQSFRADMLQRFGP